MKRPPSLLASLQGKDLGHLRIIAEHWGLTEWNAPDALTGLQRLVPLMLDPGLAREIVESLPDEARRALEDLQQQGGQMPWQVFTLRYGSIREMGAGRRDRERPDLTPVSPAERLWYRGLIGRNFFDTPGGAQEIVYLPSDLAALFPAPRYRPDAPPGRPATPAERRLPRPVNGLVLDDACTLLAARRLGLADEETLPLRTVPPRPLEALLRAAALLEEDGSVRPEAVRAFLEAPPPQALLTLWTAWLHGSQCNDLKLMPGLQSEGEWQNDPIQARQAVLDFLADIPPDTWWSLSSFVHAIRQHHPGFQRPGNDFDSWYLRDVESGAYLRGFAHWEAVDGALLRYLITGPLHYLGLLEVAAPEEKAPPTAFRWSPWAGDLLRHRPPEGLSPQEGGKILVASSGRLRVEARAPRAVRYQIARFCAWEGFKRGAYVYRLTPASLERARQQGLNSRHLLRLLARHAENLPPALQRAILQWEQHGTQARLQHSLVLRLRTPAMLEQIRRSKAARFLGEPLGPTAILVKEGAGEKVLEILAELGYLGEIG